MRRTIVTAGTLALGVLLAAGALAQTNTILNFTGFMYESDNAVGVQGFPPSNPGDLLALVGFIESVGPELDWNPAQVQLTIYLEGLSSTGMWDIGTGMYYIVYSGGTMDIVADPFIGGTVPLYGYDPPNATAPATFTDGEVYLHGEFSSFYMTYHPSLHVGSFEGYLTWTGGTQLAALFDPAIGYTVAGTVDPYAAPVPDGYDLEADGLVSFDPAIEVEEDTWGHLKSLYR